MYEIKTEDVYEDFSSDRKMFDFSNCSTKSKYYENSNKLITDKFAIIHNSEGSISNKFVIGKMKDRTGSVAIEEFVGLKPKMY